MTRPLLLTSSNPLSYLLRGVSRGPSFPLRRRALSLWCIVSAATLLDAFALSYCVPPCLTSPCLALSYFTVPYLPSPYLTLPNSILIYLALPSLTLLYLVLFCPVLPVTLKAEAASFMDLVDLQKDLRRIPVVELETPTVVSNKQCTLSADRTLTCVPCRISFICQITCRKSALNVSSLLYGVLDYSSIPQSS
jgi:hypothetical protein